MRLKMVANLRVKADTIPEQQDGSGAAAKTIKTAFQEVVDDYLDALRGYLDRDEHAA